MHDNAETVALAPGSTIKAISLWQPWATLVAEGVKCVETRGWATAYRGPLAIAATASIPAEVRYEVLGHRMRNRVNGYGHGDASIQNALYHLGYEDGGVPDGKPLPLGAVVATCTLVACWPMDGLLIHAVGRDLDTPYWKAVGGHWGLGRDRRDDPWHRCLVDHRERPFGDYSPGRYAWLLADVRPLVESIPARGRQQLWDWTVPEGVHIDGIAP